MRIGIDARMYGKGFGLARYTEQLIHHLIALEPESCTFVFFVRHAEKEALKKELSQHPHVQAECIETDIPWYSWKEQIVFPWYIQKSQVDLMHFPHWNVPLLYTKPFVLTVHDLIMYHYPRPAATTLGPLLFWCKDKVHRIVLRRAVAEARHLFVTSEFTKQDIHQTLSVPKEKMTVTYQAPFPSVGVPEQKQTLEEYGITKPYVLYVGAAYPHKNIDTLIDAWNRYIERYGNTHQLVLVGKENAFYKKVQQKIEGNTTIVYTGFAPDAALEELYREASLYVFVSLYEGFGLPPLEAMSHNIPVIASSASCLPEVLGEGACYVDPENASHIAETIHRVLTDEHMQHDLRTKAAKVVAQYSWDRLAKETFTQYEHVCSNRHSG